jgi:cell division protein FtsL
MSWQPAVLTGIAALLVAMGVFELKHLVYERERELARLERAIAEEKARIRTLRADLAWLRRPERIVTQAQQLGLAPARLDRFVRTEDLPDATALAFAGRSLTVELAAGEAVELRFKPIVVPERPNARSGGTRP